MMATLVSSSHSLKDGTSVLIRSAVVQDATPFLHTVMEYIAENEGQVWEPGEFQKTEAEEREWIQSMKENPRKILILAEVQGRIVGNIDFHPGDRKRTEHAGEFGMGILSEWRSRGVGSLLLASLLNWAKTVPQLEKINLRVLASNSRAIGLYEKFGFVEEGRRSREFKISTGVYVDEISMGLLLR